MNVGIFEVINYSHFTLVECLIKVYSTDPENTIFLCTSEKNISENKWVLDRFPDLKLLPINKDEDLENYFTRMNQFNFDIAYLVTFENPVFFESLLKSKVDYPFCLFIHNIDFWFKTSYFELGKKFVKNLLNLKQFRGLAKSFDFHFRQFRLNKKVITLILNQNKGKFAVLNQRIKELTSEFIDEQRIVVIPFSFFESVTIRPEKSNTEKLRITIPGYVTQKRRDYLGLLNAIRRNINQLKDICEFDFLGGIQNENDESTQEILILSNELSDNGMIIILHNTPSIKVNEFDQELVKADLVLANLTPKLAYGSNKESGIPFTMIKHAIPGLFQKGVYFMPELEKSILIFDNYDHLFDIIIDLSRDRSKVNHYKSEAIKSSENFKPEKIYNKLLKQHDF